MTPSEQMFVFVRIYSRMIINIIQGLGFSVDRIRIRCADDVHVERKKRVGLLFGLFIQADPM